MLNVATIDEFICLLKPNVIDRDNDYLKQFLNTLVNEVINEECQTVVRLAGRELASGWMEQMAINDIIMEMTTEEILQTGDFIVLIIIISSSIEIQSLDYYVTC